MGHRPIHPLLASPAAAERNGGALARDNNFPRSSLTKSRGSCAPRKPPLSTRPPARCGAPRQGSRAGAAGEALARRRGGRPEAGHGNSSRHVLGPFPSQFGEGVRAAPTTSAESGSVPRRVTLPHPRNRSPSGRLTAPRAGCQRRPATHRAVHLQVWWASGGTRLPPVGCHRRGLGVPPSPPHAALRLSGAGRVGAWGARQGGRRVAGSSRPLYLSLCPRSRSVFPPGAVDPALPGRQQPTSGGESKFSAAGPSAPLPSLRSRRIDELLHRRQPQAQTLI